MAFLILRYDLKEGVTEQQFETWVRETDQPTMRGLKRVTSFDTYRVSRLLMGEGRPAQRYFEMFEIDDLGGFMTEDMVGEVVQGIMGQFMKLVENPEFSVAEKL